MVQGAVDRAPEGAARLPPLGVRKARGGAVQPPVHLGIVGGHRPDIGGGDHRTSTHLVQAAALLATVVMKIYGQARIACTGRTPWEEGHESGAVREAWRAGGIAS